MVMPLGPFSNFFDLGVTFGAFDTLACSFPLSLALSLSLLLSLSLCGSLDGELCECSGWSLCVAVL